MDARAHGPSAPAAGSASPRPEDDPKVMVHVAAMLLAKGKAEEARRIAEKALALAPESGEVAARAAEVLNNSVPNWHFSIVRDRRRNDAYEAALKRAVRPDDLVLEIGAGSGLLSMMAARAGAGRVVACEMTPSIARAAEAVVARNGLSDTVRIVSSHSRDVTVGDGLPEPADVLVQEIISNDIVGESVSEALEDAWSRLLKPDARMIPAAATARVALVQDGRPDRRRMRDASGFDLTPFNRLAPPRHKLDSDDPDITLRSRPVDLITYDFQNRRRFPGGAHRAELVSDGGTVTGLAQWLRLRMDAEGEILYENAPGCGYRSAWAVWHHSFPEPVETRPGQRFLAVGSDNRHRLLLWADPIG